MGQGGEPGTAAAAAKSAKTVRRENEEEVGEILEAAAAPARSKTNPTSTSLLLNRVEPHSATATATAPIAAQQRKASLHEERANGNGGLHKEGKCNRAQGSERLRKGSREGLYQL
jgi:hypothetical protein